MSSHPPEVKGAAARHPTGRANRLGSLPQPPLADPPIPGGKVEAQMGKLIKVLSASLITRPKAAITLSAVGLGGVAFVGLCAPNSATIPVLLPLTALARRLGAPNLSNGQCCIRSRSPLLGLPGVCQVSGVTDLVGTTSVRRSGGRRR
jgi:hypothetical protein